MNTQVICFGEVLWDVLPSGPQPGGAPLNVAYHLNKSGIDAGMMSRIGDDEDGRKLKTLMNQWGINNKYLQIDNEFSTSRVIATLNDDNEVSYQITFPVAWDYIVRDKNLIDEIDESAYLIYGSLASRNEVTRNTLFELLDTPVIKVFDINLRPPFIEQETLKQLLLKADIVKFNQAELEMVQSLFGGSKGSEGEQIVFVMHEFDLKGVIVTKGASGASYYTAEAEYHSSGRSIDVNDTIGSGDAFLATFVAGLYYGDDAAEILENAIAMGAFVATRQGGCPDYEYEEFIRFKEKIFI